MDKNSIVQFLEKKRQALEREHAELGDKMQGILIEVTELDKMIGILQLEGYSDKDTKG